MPRKPETPKSEHTGPYFESRLAKLMNERLNSPQLSLNQRDIANRVGYPNPNMITMLKQGSSKMPLDRVSRFAEILNVEPTHFFELAMEQLYPEKEANPVHSIFKGVLPTEDEIEMLKIIREVKGESPKNYRHQDEVAKKARAQRLEAFREAVKKVYAKD